MWCEDMDRIRLYENEAFVNVVIVIDTTLEFMRHLARYLKPKI